MLRAYLPEEKELRRRAILAGARALFMDVSYPALRMTDLAKRLNLGKGTLYLYFPTKEALFLAVLRAELEDWFIGAAHSLEGAPVGAEPRQVAAALVRELMQRPLLPKLQALLHGVLEQNVPAKDAHAFARFLQFGVRRVGERLERVLPALRPGQGPLYLIRFHGLVIGSQLMSARPPALREALREPDMGLFDFDFETVIGETAADLLLGMLAG